MKPPRDAMETVMDTTMQDTVMEGVQEPPPNRMRRELARTRNLPAFLQAWGLNRALRRAIPFTGTAKLDFVNITTHRAEIALANHAGVRNHLGGVHASAMNLLAETASGMVVGMNVLDGCVPLVKEMHVAWRKRATGALRAVATLSEPQRFAMFQQPSGEVRVSVVVTDEAGVVPVECEFIWAWIPAGPRKN